MPGKWGGARRARPPPRSANGNGDGLKCIDRTWWAVVHGDCYVTITGNACYVTNRLAKYDTLQKTTLRFPESNPSMQRSGSYLGSMSIK